MKANVLVVPGMEINSKNIDLKSWNFWESLAFGGEGLNSNAKTNMVQFINKMISWSIDEPLAVEAVVNGTSVVDSWELQNIFLQRWLVDSMWWKYNKITNNLKSSIES
jgi:hypothetical protein